MLAEHATRKRCITSVYNIAPPSLPCDNYSKQFLPYFCDKKLELLSSSAITSSNLLRLFRALQRLTACILTRYTYVKREPVFFSIMVSVVVLSSGLIIAAMHTTKAALKLKPEKTN